MGRKRTRTPVLIADDHPRGPDAASERQIWGDSFDGESADLFRLQDHVTQGVTRAILPNIRGAEIERARRKRLEDLDAYDLTMRALPLAFAANPD